MLRKRLVFVVLACFAVTRPAAGDPGKWTPEQLLQFDPARLKSIGLELPASELWKPEGGGLLEATVQISGCTASFISDQGLMVTNHHCAFSILQQHSTPERDLITHGFLAARLEDELPAASVRATIPVLFADVTAQIEAAAASAKDDYERFLAIDRKKKELVAACEAAPQRRCQVAAFDDGVSYQLIEAVEFPDVRLVYAPPRAIGEYGGEVDNWSWPRHTGDVALLRVYAAGGKEPTAYDAANLPYKPRRFFPIATGGVADGDFVMVLGYPGVTFRSLIAAEMAERNELFFPRRAALYRDWMDLMEAAGANDEAARIALADRLKTLSNREKNARGQLEGIRRGQLLDKKRQADTAVLAWAGAKPEQQAAVAAYRALEAQVAEGRATWDRDFLLSQLRAGSKSLALAMTLSRWAIERSKPDLEREAEYQERNWGRLADELERDQKRLHEPTEKKLLADALLRFALLPAGERLASIDALLGSNHSPAAVAAQAEALVSGSKVGELEERRKMGGETVEQLTARHDPLLDLALALNRQVIEIERRDKAAKGTVSRLRPQWRRAVAAERGTPLDPDANGTLRVSFAHVGGYQPKDGIWMKPFTSLAGVVAKDTGEEPFRAPDKLLAAAGAAPQSRWVDRGLEDVPVCFLASGDTTGGNSGSPVVNGRGELVGVNFDRVWENVANDFGYNPDIARNISVDVRYLLWMLDTFEGEKAKALLAELGIKE